MSVDYLNFLPNEDGAEGGEEGEKIGEGVLSSNDLVGDIVDFETVG